MMLFQSSPVVAERIHDLISRAPEHERPPWLAVADHGCAYAIVLQGEGPFTVPSGAPAILRIGDDLHTSHGLAGFDRKSVKVFLRRARSVVIVSSAPTLEAYSLAAGAAAVQRRDVVLIETQPEHEGEWATFVRKYSPMASLLISTPFTRAMAH